MPPVRRERKSHIQPQLRKNPGRKELQLKSSDAPIKGTKPKGRKNLTPANWLEVYEWVAEHKHLSQASVINYFENRPTCPLNFSQCTLSRNLRMERRKELEARAREYENGLLSKRPRSACVTEPKVDKALSIWFKDKTKEGKAVPRAMLEAKRRLVEEELNIPEEKRLHWGWIQSFLRANKPQGTQKSQKASSADNQPLSQPGTLSHCQPIPPVNNDRSITSRTLNVHSTSPLPDKGVSSARGSNTTPTDHAMVEQERLRIQALLAKFAPKDRWNADEAALIICTAPEQGERKSNSSRITVCLACNADGSEKKEVFFIGKDESSHCFAGVEPDQREFSERDSNLKFMVDGWSNGTSSWLPSNAILP